MASMRNWLREEGRNGGDKVAVVHCKAGKGRSGTISCSYLISEEGWSAEDALQRFTQRRMRPSFGAGVSIPSQLRWVDYVSRWTKHGKLYIERQIEILEVHVWGIRDGVSASVQGFVDEGKTIKTFHTFAKEERHVVGGSTKGKTDLVDVVHEVMRKSNGSDCVDDTSIDRQLGQDGKRSSKLSSDPRTSTSDGARASESDNGDVIFKPSKRVVLPSNDVNIDFEGRNGAGYGWTMVTSVAHVWFNAYFEGQRAENADPSDDSGVFDIAWEAMDGIKGSSRKGIKAFDRIAVVWKALKDGDPGSCSKMVITEPGPGETVEQSRPADWKGQQSGIKAGDRIRKLGLRTENVEESGASRAGSVRSQETCHTPTEHEAEDEGLRVHGPSGEE